MGINFNKNSFGKLTTAKLNQSKAAKNAGNIADTKASNAAKEGNSLNSATLKSNQGLKIDSNTLFDKMGDVVPANDNPPVAKGKKKDGDKKADDKGGKKKSFSECLAESSKELNTAENMKKAGMDANGSAYTGAAVAMVVNAVIKYFGQ